MLNNFDRRYVISNENGVLILSKPYARGEYVEKRDRDKPRASYYDILKSDYVIGVEGVVLKNRWNGCNTEDFVKAQPLMDWIRCKFSK